MARTPNDFMPSRLIDADAVLESGAAARTATGNGTGGAYDLAGSDDVTEQYGEVIADVSAVKYTAGDENYQLLVQGCNASNFSSDVENLAILELGDASVLLGGADIDPGVGQHRIPFCNTKAGRNYRYVRLRYVIAGTSPSITFKAWLGALPKHAVKI